jgi:hypothetical protein
LVTRRPYPTVVYRSCCPIPPSGGRCHNGLIFTLRQPSPDAERPTRRQYLARAAEIATIIATLIALVPAGRWLYGHLFHAGRTTPPGGRASSPATTPQPTPGARVYLTTLTPDTGAPNRGPLPHALAGRPGYDHTLTIPCPTNQAADTSRSVTYLLSSHYQRLHAVLKPYLPVSDESRVRLDVFVDRQPPVGPTVPVNQSAPLDVDVYGRRTVELRITCESPDATAILTDAYLEHV